MVSIVVSGHKSTANLVGPEVPGSNPGRYKLAVENTRVSPASLERFFFYLRIPDSYAKTLKIHTPMVRFALYFQNQAVYQNLKVAFLKDGPVIKESAKM